MDQEVQTALDRILAPYKGEQSELIPILQEVQEALGYLPPEALRAVSQHTGIRLSRIHGVVTFYAQFYLEPHGRHTVKVCRGTACYVKGGKRIRAAVERHLGLAEGETTRDMMFSYETVACLGACALAPVMVIDGVYYGKMTPPKAETVLTRLSATEGGMT